MRRWIFCALCALFAALLLIVPSVFIPGAHNEVIRRWLNAGKLAYEGKLVVYAVDAGADGKGALFAYLNERAAAFERRYFGIYPIVYEPMTMGEVEARIDAGESPDVLLCADDIPGGVLAKAAPFTGSFALPQILPQRLGGRLTPLYQGGVVVLVHEDALYRHGLSPPAGIEGMDDQWVSYVLEGMPSAFAYEDGRTLMAAVMGEVGDGAQEALRRGSCLDMRAFLKGEAAVYATSQRALWELYRQELLGATLPGVIVYPLGGFVPRVQYAVLMQNADAERQSAAQAFIAMLLGKSAQAALGDIYALPASAGVSCNRMDLAALWQRAEEAELVYAGRGEEAFLQLAQGDAPLESLREFVRTLCYPP
jgi:hypothetical protein